MLNSASHTDDVVQEAFLKAYREIHRFQGQSKLGTWLYRIAINQALDFVRKQQRRERWLTFFSPVEEDDGNPAPEASVEPLNALNLQNAELRESIDDAMSELSVEHRAVIQLRLIDEMSLDETARLLRCKPGTVNSRLHYACNHLKRKLKNKLAAV